MRVQVDAALGFKRGRKCPFQLPTPGVYDTDFTVGHTQAKLYIYMLLSLLFINIKYERMGVSNFGRAEKEGPLPKSL